MLMQAKGQAVRSDALACYGVQIGQRLRYIDAPASAIDESLLGSRSNINATWPASKKTTKQLINRNFVVSKNRDYY